jgi:hypothetical protein
MGDGGLDDSTQKLANNSYKGNAENKLSKSVIIDVLDDPEMGRNQEQDDELIPIEVNRNY